MRSSPEAKAGEAMKRILTWLLRVIAPARAWHERWIRLNEDERGNLNWK